MSLRPRKKEASQDFLDAVTRIRREQDADANRLALDPAFEIGYSPIGSGVIDFVNVSTSIGPAQGSTGSPNQVTGLTVTPQGGSNTQLNLTWTAAGGTDFNYYNVYRAVTSGFIVGPSFKIAQPVTNSYNNTGLAAGTTYYYRVSTTNDAELEGAASSQVSAATTGRGPDFWLALNNNYNDSSANNTTPDSYPPFASYTPNGFGTPGKFGSHYWNCNTPVDSLGGYTDHIDFGKGGGDSLPIPVQPDFTTGFSYSIWVYPTDLSNSGARRIILEHLFDSNNIATLQFDSAGVILFAVRKAGATIRRQISGLVTNSWQHIAAVYDAVANTVRLYRNAVEGAGSSLTPEYAPSGYTNQFRFGIGSYSLGDPPRFFKGRMDEIQYFKGYRLSAGEVTNLMNTNTV